MSKKVEATQIFQYVPKKYTHVAMDSDGEWCLFESSPTLGRVEVQGEVVSLWTTDNASYVALEDVTDVKIRKPYKGLPTVAWRNPGEF